MQILNSIQLFQKHEYTRGIQFYFLESLVLDFITNTNFKNLII